MKLAQLCVAVLEERHYNTADRQVNVSGGPKNYYKMVYS